MNEAFSTTLAHPIQADTPRPRPPLAGLARLMSRAFQGADLAPLAAALIERASTDQDDADALMDLSIVLQLQGIRDLGVTTQAHALATRRLYGLGSRDAPALRLLAIMAPGDLMTNTPLEFLVEHSDISLTMLYLVPGEPMPRQWPAHDVSFIAVSQSEATEAQLERLSEVAWPLPVVNRPGLIANTSRTRAWRLLHGVSGLAMPMTARASRAELTRLAQGALPIEGVIADGCFPLIVRPVDSHAGRSLAKVDSAAEIAAYLRATGGDAFFISRFIDYRDGDGLFRKYRIVFIDGVAHAGHMGISSHWMIHYLNAGMADSADKRAEEEAFMRDFDVGFKRRHAPALRAITERFGLDYLVIDCGETRDGELLVFEVCTGAVVHAMDPADVFPYKRPHMDRIFAAFRSMLTRRAVDGETTRLSSSVPAIELHPPGLAAGA
jgi:hypothetical protein